MEIVALAPHKTQRLQFLDVAKGILILMVVMGHSKPPFSQYIYWFHIPGFFLVSGLLHKQPDGAAIKTFIRKKASALLLPYFAFGICISLIVALWNLPMVGMVAVKSLVFQILRLAYSGAALFGAFGAFWFIPCLFLTIVFFTGLLYFITNKKWVIAILFLCYAVGIGLSYFKNIFFPWSINVVPVALFFYGTGYFSKEIIFNIYQTPHGKKPLFLTVFALCGLLVFLSDRGYFAMAIDMKVATYSNPVLAIVTSLLFTSATIFLSIIINKIFVSKLLAYIGFNSLIIMYLHLPVNFALESVTHFKPHYSLFVLFGTAIPLFIGHLLNKNQFASTLFLGRQQKLI